MHMCNNTFASDAPLFFFFFALSFSLSVFSFLLQLVLLSSLPPSALLALSCLPSVPLLHRSVIARSDQQLTQPSCGLPSTGAGRDVRIQFLLEHGLKHCS